MSVCNNVAVPVFGESLSAEGACEGGLLGVAAVVGGQLGPVPQDFPAGAAGARVGERSLHRVIHSIKCTTNFGQNDLNVSNALGGS